MHEAFHQDVDSKADCPRLGHQAQQLRVVHQLWRGLEWPFEGARYTQGIQFICRHMYSTSFQWWTNEEGFFEVAWLVQSIHFICIHFISKSLLRGAAACRASSPHAKQHTLQIILKNRLMRIFLPETCRAPTSSAQATHAAWHVKHWGKASWGCLPQRVHMYQARL